MGQDTVAMVMEFFEKHQAKMAVLDDRLLAVREEKKKVEERIKVLQANANRINPDRKVVSKETVRYEYFYVHNNYEHTYTIATTQSCIHHKVCITITVVHGDSPSMITVHDHLHLHK